MFASLRETLKVPPDELKAELITPRKTAALFTVNLTSVKTNVTMKNVT